MLRPPSFFDRVDCVVAEGEDPILRNRRITQGYHDLAVAFRDVTGVRDPNWCTFACWASATAGTFIRKETMPFGLGKNFRDPAAQSRALAEWLPVGKGVPSAAKGLLKFRTPNQLIEQLADTVSLEITRGNLKVFAELGPIFRDFVMLYQNDASTEEREAFFAKLTPGASDEDGQWRLQRAFRAYEVAIASENKRERIQSMLLGNLLVGQHEQIRLDNHIKGGFTKAFQLIVDILTKNFLAWPLHIPRVKNALEQAWLDVFTNTMMTLRLPDEVVDLALELPPPPSRGSHYPLDLDRGALENPELLLLLETYQGYGATARAAGARDWTKLADRMRYIIELFRSRHGVDSLFEEPFPAEEHASIAFKTPAPAAKPVQTEARPRLQVVGAEPIPLRRKIG